MSAAVAAAFFYFLNFSNSIKFEHIYFGLPVIALLLYWFKNLKIHNPNFQILRLFIGTGLSQFFGASTGRETAVVEMCKKFSENFKKTQQVVYYKDELLLIAKACGFSAIIGQPIAALVFAVEKYYAQTQIKVQKLQFLFYVLLLSSCSYFIAKYFFNVSYFDFKIELTKFSIKNVSSYVLVFLVCYFLGYIFHFLKRSLHRYNHSLLFVVGLSFVIVLLIYIFEPKSALGLSLGWFDYIASGQTLAIREIILKYILTLLCVSADFLGGEFIPSQIMGAALGIYLCQSLGASVFIGAVVGSVAMISSIMKIPKTALVLAILWLMK